MNPRTLRILLAGVFALAFSLTTTLAQADDTKQADRDAKRQAELEKYDENKDGKINKNEREKIKADREAEQAAKKADREAKKSEKAAIAEQKKAEKEARKAEREAKKGQK